MEEPTHGEFKILESIDKNGGYVLKKDSDSDIESFWPLVRSGHINNLVMLGGQYDWKFKLTQKSIDYLESQKK